MTGVEAGEYVFIHYGYSDEQYVPQLTLLAPLPEQFHTFHPRGQTITLRVDTAKRFCTGWHDLATAQSYPCPDKATLPEQYEQCRHCQTKTGFNPAFYNANSVSKQQEARNQLPHSLYLAHFGPGIVKVGITWADRGLKRLLEQGARSALIVKTFPTATNARQYEAKAAKLAGIVETIQYKAKAKLLPNTYDPELGLQELLSAEQRLVQEIALAPEGNKPHSLDIYYLNKGSLKTNKLIILNEETSISGNVIGMIGSLLIFEQADSQFAFPLSKWRGYRLQLSYEEQLNEHAPQQVSLF